MDIYLLHGRFSSVLIQLDFKNILNESRYSFLTGTLTDYKPKPYCLRHFTTFSAMGWDFYPTPQKTMLKLFD